MAIQIRFRVNHWRLPVSDWVFVLATWPGMTDFWHLEKTHGRTPEFVQFMDEHVVDQ
jgi:hypothetical protein